MNWPRLESLGRAGLAREPPRRGEEGWEGPVFLPESRRGKGLFFARIRGHTQAYPFLPGKDSVTIRPSPDSEVLQALVDSHFVAKEWVVREDAMHAKSKTYKRADVLAGMGQAEAADPAAADVTMNGKSRHE